MDREKTGNCFEQCRLAGAVRSDQAENLASLHRKANVFKRTLPCVMLGKRSDPQHNYAFLVDECRRRQHDSGSIKCPTSPSIIASLPNTCAHDRDRVSANPDATIRIKRIFRISASSTWSRIFFPSHAPISTAGKPSTNKDMTLALTAP